jgi:hypothetical protein
LLLRFSTIAEGLSSLDGFTPDQACFHPAATPHGTLTLAEAPLVDTENLFRRPGLPQFAFRFRAFAPGGASRDRGVLTIASNFCHIFDWTFAAQTFKFDHKVRDHNLELHSVELRRA